MTRQELQTLIDSFLETLDDTNDREWYTDQRDIAHHFLNKFLDHVAPCPTDKRIAELEAEIAELRKQQGEGK